RCPLHCPYCSNPVRYPNHGDELTTGEWRRVFREAAELGIVHALLSGGEPLVRCDLPQIVSAARDAGLYTNLITSAVGLTRERASELKESGLESVQISFQSDGPKLADAIAGATAHELKIEAAAIVRELDIP